MGKKIFFFDLDETLLTTDKKLSPKTYEALKVWDSKGNIIAINSGRPMASVIATIKEHRLDAFNTYAIAFDGAQVKDLHTGQDIIKKTVSLSDCAIAAKILKENHTHIHAYSDDSILSCADDEEIHFYTRTVKLPFRVLSDFPEGIEYPPCKLLGVRISETETLPLLGDKVYEACDGRVTCLMSNPHLLEIFPSSAGKGTALKELAATLGVDIKDTFAAGDAPNDISMLEEAGCGIAMINGDPEVKKAADMITEYDNNHDGLADIIIANA